MPEPEIARRCPSCGVTIRVRASFCPECGKPLPPKSDAEGTASDADMLTTTGPAPPELIVDTSESAATAPLVSPELISDISEVAATVPLSSPELTASTSEPAATVPLRSSELPANLSDPAETRLLVSPESLVETPNLAGTVPLGSPEFTAGTSGSAATAPLVSHAETLPLDSKDTIATPSDVLSTSSSALHRRPRQATLEAGHRAGPPPRHVIGEDGRNRVEKFRQMSSAVIDEAAYDPSMRFLLVAAVLFVLFLVLLLLSELIT